MRPLPRRTRDIATYDSHARTLGPFPPIYPGVPYRVNHRRKDLRLACCDCGLIHRIRFNVRGEWVILRALRNGRIKVGRPSSSAAAVSGTTYQRRVDLCLCTRCGVKPPRPGARMCGGCTTARRAYSRAYNGFNSWVPGGPGRRPTTADECASAEGEARAVSIASTEPDVPLSWPTFISRGRARYGLPR